MHLTSIRIAGWRSFAPDTPFVLEGLGRLNVLLGPNGAGKSNLGRFAEWLAGGLAQLGAGRVVQHQLSPLGMLFPFREVDSWMREGGPVDATLSFQVDRLPRPLPEWAESLFPGDKTLEVRLRADRQGDSDQWRVSLFPYSRDGEPFYRQRRESMEVEVRTGPGRYEARGNEDGPQLLALGLAQELPRRLLRIHALRHPDAPASLGTEITKALAQLSQADASAREWTRVRGNLERWLTRLLGEDVSADAPGEGLRLTTHRLRLPFLLRDAGDGIEQIVFLLARLTLAPQKPTIVFLDEPEAHLHPGATIDLLRIIEDELPWVQAIIATHSPTVVDALSPDWRFWRLHRGAGGATSVEPVATQPARIAALDALGVSASQMFLAAVVVWVEGPSDAIYYRRLLADVAPDLIYRRDYSFATYGGSAGSHLALDDDPEAAVDVLRLAHRNLLIYDSGARIEAPAFVEEWKRALAEQGLLGAVLAPPGREVENIVLPTLLAEVAARCVSSVREGGTAVEITIPSATRITPGGCFAEELAASATLLDGGELDDRQRARVRRQLEAKKTTLARVVVNDERRPLFTEVAAGWGSELAQEIRTLSGRSPDKRDQRS